MVEHLPFYIYYLFSQKQLKTGIISTLNYFKLNCKNQKHFNMHV